MTSKCLNLNRYLVLIGLLFLMSVAAAAQGGINGNVLLPNGAFLNEPARIILQTSRGVKSNVYTDNRGHFQFIGLTPSIYEVVVVADGDRFEVAKVTVEVFPGAPLFINVSLKEKKQNGPKSSPTAVSVGELDPGIPAQAKKEFELASVDGNSGKIADAIVHLRKAIEIYPNYLMAHNDLGSQLLSQSKLVEAAGEFRRAIQLDDKAFNPRLNLGIVLVQQHEFSEAVETLKAALALQPNSPAGILYHGLALEGINDLAGAEHELKSAYDIGGVAYAIALFYLGKIHLVRGEREKSRKDFESYVRVDPNGPYAAEAKKMIGILR